MKVLIDYDEMSDVLYASYGNTYTCREAENDYEFLLNLDKEKTVVGVTIIGFAIIPLQQMISTPEWKEIPLDVQTEVVNKWEEIHNNLTVIPFSETVKQKIIEANKKWQKEFGKVIKEMEKDN